MITHLGPDILELEVKWALESITINKASGGDGIPVYLFQILKKMAIGTYISIITLDVNRLMLQPKDTGWLNGYRNNTHVYAVYKKTTSDLKTHIE